MIQEWQLPEEKLLTGPKKAPDPWTTHRDGRQVCHDSAAGKREYRWRTELMWQRQGETCAIGNHFITVEEATFDHQDGRGHGGGHRTDAINDAEGNWINAAVCNHCNILKGSRRFTWVNGKYLPTLDQLSLVGREEM